MMGDCETICLENQNYKYKMGSCIIGIICDGPNGLNM